MYKMHLSGSRKGDNLTDPIDIENVFHVVITSMIISIYDRHVHNSKWISIMDISQIVTCSSAAPDLFSRACSLACTALPVWLCLKDSVSHRVRCKCKSLFSRSNHDHVSCLFIGGRAPFLLRLDLFSVLRGGSEFLGREANMFSEV